jgi:hypothetical protein
MHFTDMIIKSFEISTETYEFWLTYVTQQGLNMKQHFKNVKFSIQWK